MVYVMSSMPSHVKSLKEVNDLIFKFLWDNKGDKIKRTEMIADYQDGGLKMLDIIEFNKALKITWILKYISDDCQTKWKAFFDFYLLKFGGKLVFTSNLARKDVKILDIKSTFLHELIELWSDLNFKESFASRAEFGAESIWNNSMIRIAGKTIFYKHWFEAGVHNINDLLTSDSKLMTYSCFRNKWCPNVSFLEYYGVASAIRCAFKTLKLRLPDDPNPKYVLALLNSSKKPSQLAYQIYRDKKCTCPEKSQAKWLRDCESEDALNFNWRSIYLLPRKCTLSTKLRNFQFKFLHRRIATNSFLFKIKFSDTDLCCFCQNAQETLIHLFWDCPVTNVFWKNIQNFLISVNLIQTSRVLRKTVCLGLDEEKGEILVNHCLLLARYYIFSCKFNNTKPLILEYLYQIKSNLQLEKQISVTIGMQKAFEKKWHKIIESLWLSECFSPFFGPSVFFSCYCHVICYLVRFGLPFWQEIGTPLSIIVKQYCNLFVTFVFF